MTSGKMTILAGRGKDFFVFVPDVAYVGEFPANSLVSYSHGLPEERGHSKPFVNLKSLEIDVSSRLDGTKELSGSVMFEKLSNATGFFVLRFTYKTGNTSFSSYQHLGEIIGGDSGRLSFKVPPNVDSENKLNGLFVVFVDLCSFVNENRRGAVLVASNTVAEMVIVD